MKVLIVTAMWPTAQNPAFGSFVSSQVLCLQRAGLDIELLVLEGEPRKLIYPRGVVQIHQRLKDKSIDIVHAHYGYVGWVARLQWIRPVIVTYHGDDVLGTVNRRGNRTVLSRAAAALCTSLGRAVDGVVVQSEQMARRFRNARVYVIPHEVDLQIFQPSERSAARRELGLSDAKKYVLFAANPDIPVKRFPLAKEAVDRLRSQDPSVELLVVFRETQRRLALYMSACDVLVFPSYQEGSPNVVKQAMACNLPIVATDVGDVRDIIGGSDGCSICPPTVEHFAASLREALQSPARTKGRQRVEHLAGPLVADRLIRVYEEALGARRVSAMAADRLT